MNKIKYSTNTIALLNNKWQTGQNIFCNSYSCKECAPPEEAIISFSEYNPNEVYTDFYCSNCLNLKIKEGHFGNNYITVNLKDIDPDRIIKQLNQMAILL